MDNNFCLNFFYNIEFNLIINSFKIIRINNKNSMQENGSPIENQKDDFTDTSSTDNEYSKWVDNQGDEVKLSLIHI